MTDDETVSLAPGAGFARFDQTFPTLTAGEIERMRRFGEVRRFAAGEMLFRSGPR